MLRVIALLALLIWTLPAEAMRLPLDPQNRLHVGLTSSDGLTLGGTVGFDSRMTRMVFVDVGGFVSPTPTPELSLGDADPEDFIFLRHGLFVAPGVRVPHRQPKGFSWDVILRGGFASVWSTDVWPENRLVTGTTTRYEIEQDPALLTGVDFQVRVNPVGVRLSGKQVVFQPYSQLARDDLTVVGTLWAAELLYQW